MAWDDQIAEHEAKIRRQSRVAGIIIGILLTIASIFLLRIIQ